MATLRFSLTALILLPFALARWRRSPTSARALSGAALIGVTMLVAVRRSRSGARISAGRGGRRVRLFLALFAWGVFD